MLNYKIHGDTESGNMPLIVQHGLLGSLDNWNTFANQQKDERPIIAIDMRNHGDSPHVEGMSYTRMSDDVLAVLDHLQLDTVDLMGHSMGGKVAMWLALHHPERIHNLIIVDIVPVEYPLQYNGLIQAMLDMPLADFKSRREADTWLAPTVKQPFERAFLLKNLAWDENKNLVWQCHLTEIAKHYPSIASFPATELTYSGHAVFISGGQSNYVTADGWQAALKRFPHAEHIVIEQAGHLPHVQTPDEFNRHVNASLS
ncbi:MAG: alpha/beta fold hydrolase [Thiolinea sp.]